MLLRLEGHEVMVADDGPTALRLFDERQPEVALLDIGVPQMNGYEVARRMRSRPGGKRVLLVALTGWGQEKDRAASRDAGFDHHLVKPDGDGSYRGADGAATSRSGDQILSVSLLLHGCARGGFVAGIVNEIRRREFLFVPASQEVPYEHAPRGDR